MPQARSAGSSSNKPAGTRRVGAKGSAAKPASARKTAAAASRPAAASKPSAARKPAAAASKSSAARKPAATKKPAATSKSGPAGATSKAASRARVTIQVDADGGQIEAIASRLRKLNERIIEIGREAGEGTLTSYERALKTIASGIAQTPAKDEVGWIAHLATSQAKFVREITDSWAKAARERLK